MGDRVVADQWGCDVPLPGSDFQQLHVDYRRPLFEEAPDLQLPRHILAVSFGLVSVTPLNGALEIAPGTHRMPGAEAIESVECGKIELQPVPLGIGDVLIRHPWTLHRGTPNTTDTPRPLVSMRYVRCWYTDDSREVNSIPRATWRTLSRAQQRVMRFPIGGYGAYLRTKNTATSANRFGLTVTLRCPARKNRRSMMMPSCRASCSKSLTVRKWMLGESYHS
jgi:ectoine hydroxylase-related dioxygenase (phytanoyl-CoA dioxygenase family)